MKLKPLAGKLYVLFMAMAFLAMALFPKSVPMWLGLSLVSGLIEFEFLGLPLIRTSAKLRWALYIPLIYVLIYFVSCLYSQDIDAGIRDGVRRLTLFLVPLFVLVKGLDKTKIVFWKKSFIIGLLATLLLANAKAALACYRGEDSFVFFGESGFLFLHIGYVAMYILSAIAILLDELLKPKEERTLSLAWTISLLILFAFELFLTGSKMGFLSLVALLLLSVFRAISKGLNGKKILLIGSALVVMSILFFQTEYLKNRFNSVTLSTELDKTSVESTQARRMTWDCAWEQLKARPLLGYGAGDVSQAMMDCYKTKSYTGPASRGLGPHNQYLESGLAAGVPALLSLIALFLFPLVVAIRRRQFLVCLILFIFIMNALTESVFERALGIHLFALWYAPMLFLAINKPSELHGEAQQGQEYYISRPKKNA